MFISDYDSELLIPNSNGQMQWPRMKKGQSNERLGLAEHVCEEEVLLNNNIEKQSGDLVEISSEVVEQGMDDYVPNKIDGAQCEKVPNHVVNKGNLEVLVCKQVANHGGDTTS
ncbi:hypothetical protein Tco_0741860 [Tanacetum coccineum]